MLASNQLKLFYFTQQSFSCLILASLLRTTSGLLTSTLYGYHETVTQQVATLAANQQHLLQYHQAADNCGPVPASPNRTHLQTPAPASPNRSSCHTKQKNWQTSSSLTKQPTSASSSSRHLHHPSPSNTILLGKAPALRGDVNILVINQGLDKLEHGSSGLCNQCVHIFDRLQLHLQPDHTASPTICTKLRDHTQDHPDPLDALSKLIDSRVYAFL